MRKNTRKLVVHKVTLRHLGADELTGAAGGTIAQTFNCLAKTTDCLIQRVSVVGACSQNCSANFTQCLSGCNTDPMFGC